MGVYEQEFNAAFVLTHYYSAVISKGMKTQHGENSTWGGRYEAPEDN